MDSAYLSGSFWQQTYWGDQQDAFGASLSASTTVPDGISVYLSGNWSRARSTGMTTPARWGEYSVHAGRNTPLQQ
ncbi:hypothetical protein [Yokenella regensburgei]|uniref:hypothetical protein n=1 Tax=Yokenella regensburgei TaxID=158877 RepID=UPI001FD82D7C|nr:hypothetical protein [Yokenella regensburgei]